MRKQIYTLNEVIRFFFYAFLITAKFPITNSQYNRNPPPQSNDQVKIPYYSVVNFTDSDLNSDYNNLENIYDETENLPYSSNGDKSDIQQVYPSTSAKNFSNWFGQLLNNSQYDDSVQSFNFSSMFSAGNASERGYYPLPKEFKVFPNNKNITALNVTLPANIRSQDARNVFKNALDSNTPSVNDDKIFVNIPHINSLSLNETNKNSSSMLEKFVHVSQNLSTSQMPHTATLKPNRKPRQSNSAAGMDTLAKKISEDISKNSTNYLNNVFSKMGLQNVAMNNISNDPLYMYKFNMSNLPQMFNSTRNSSISNGVRTKFLPVSSPFSNQNVSVNRTAFNSQSIIPVGKISHSDPPSVSNLPSTSMSSPMTNQTTLPANTIDPSQNQTSATDPPPNTGLPAQPTNISFAATANDSFSDQYGEIIYSSVFFVHGSPTPSPLPSDPYSDVVYWPEGLNQLTNDGKNEMYQLGKWLYQRYSHMIGFYYNASLIQIDSGEDDVTLTSAECLATGMFPPSGYEVWDRSIQWQPIPIHGIPTYDDNIILMSKYCQQYNLQVENLDDSSKWLTFYDNSSAVLQYIGNNTGANFTRGDVLNDLQKIYTYYQNFKIEEARGFSLPNWTQAIYPQPLTSMAEKYIDFSVETRQLQKIKTGPFFQVLINNMQKKINNTYNSPQFLEVLHLYSGNKLALGFIMKTLGIFNSTIPSNAATLIFDLRFKNNEYIVTVSYKNSSADHLYLVNIPNCQPICTFDNFINITNDLISSNWEDDCATVSISDLTYTIPIVIFGVVIIFILALVVVLLCIKCCKYVRGKKTNFR